MATRKLVHKQFNSPMGLYSKENVKETLKRELKAFGTDGIEIDEHIAKPLNLANSAVLRAVEEEEKELKCGYKRVAWPPISEERIVHEFTPQPTQQAPLPQQSSAAVQPTYRAASYDNYQQEQQQQQNHYQPAYQQQQQPQQKYGYGYQQQQPAWANNNNNLSEYAQGHHEQYAPTASTVYPTTAAAAAATATTAQQYSPYNVESQTNQAPYNSYSQFQQQQYQQHQSSSAISQDQVDQQLQEQALAQANKAQSLPQDYRGGSPGIITLRKEAPVSQKPAPVYNSQPAAISFQGGSNMRGDLKWPPPEYKEAAARENEERRKLALGPVCRPRKVKRDYTSFFAKNALNCYYPSYKVPPGTQHMLA